MAGIICIVMPALEPLLEAPQVCLKESESLTCHSRHEQRVLGAPSTDEEHSVVSLQPMSKKWHGESDANPAEEDRKHRKS